MGSSAKSTATTEPFIGNNASFVYGQVQPEIAKRLQRFQGYTGQINYGTTANQTSAFNNLANTANNTQFINDAISGKNLDLANNLYYQTNLKKLGDESLKNANKAFTMVNSSMNRGGMYDSSARRNALTKQADLANENFANASADLAANVTQNERQNQQAAYNAQQSVLGNVLSAANYQQQQGQADVDRLRQNYWDTITQGDKNLQFVLDYVDRIKNPYQSQSSNTSDPLRVLGK